MPLSALNLESHNPASPDAAHDVEQRARAAAHLFVRPRRREVLQPPSMQPVRTLQLPEGALRYWLEHGSGDPVLLLHGWEGSPADLDGVAQALRERGRAIAWVELPAHGASPVEWTSVPHAARAVARLGEVLGPLHAIVAHSVGGALAALAMREGLRARRAVLIGAPAEYRDYVNGFARQLDLGPAGARALSQTLTDQYGIDVERVSTPAAAQGLNAAALVIHSRDDPVVPWQDAEVIAAAWPGARLLRVDGLGHRRILADLAVIAAVVSHLDA